MITLNEIVAGQKQVKQASFNTDLFKGDREPIDFDKSAYSQILLCDTNHQAQRGGDDKLIESVICIGHESDFYMVTAVHTSFNGEKQVSFTQQETTLKGFNYFTKDCDEDFEEVYNLYLNSKGYEITVEDIKTLGELNTQYNVITLSFIDDNESKHYLTVNSKDQLSSVTVKHTDRKVNSKSSFQSAFK